MQPKQLIEQIRIDSYHLGVDGRPAPRVEGLLGIINGIADVCKNLDLIFNNELESEVIS